MKLKKYLFEFLAIFIAITASFLLDEWRETRQHRDETKKALEFIKMDIRIDTNYYKLRMNRLERHAKALEKGLDGSISSANLDDMKSLLTGLRGNADYEIQHYGFNYLSNNIRMPIMKNDTLLISLGLYYDLSSSTGNYGLFGREHFRLASDNYYKMFEAFPRFLDKDTTIANNAIREGMDDFLNDPYWQGRINLMHREADRSMQLVYDKNLKFAEYLLDQIEKELDDDVGMYYTK